MKLRTLLPIAAVGGFLYLHVKRGGRLTLESLAGTARSLFRRAKRDAEQVKDRAEKAVIHDMAATVAEATETR
jgi:hypothetical protein